MNNRPGQSKIDKSDTVTYEMNMYTGSYVKNAGEVKGCYLGDNNG